MSERLRRIGGDTFQSMHHRNFRLFFGGQLISQIGNWLTMVAQALLVLKLTNSGVALGLLTAFQFLPVLLLGPFAGLVADRSDKRRLLIGVQVIAGVQSVALGTLALMDRPPVIAIFLVAMVGGVTTAFDNPSRRAFVVEMVPDSEVNNAVSLNSALMTSSRMIGPAMAGLLIITVGYSWCFYLDALSYIAVIYGLWAMNPAELRQPPTTPRSKGQISSGLRYARANHELFTPLVMMAIIGTLTFNFSVVMPLFVTHTFHRSESTYTLLLSVVSIGSVIGALTTARRKSVSVHDVVVGALAFGAAMVVFSAVPVYLGIFPVAVFVGFTSMVFMTASTAIVQIRSDPQMRGRVLALQAMVFLGSTPIGGPIIGAVSQYVSPRAGIALGGLACVVAAAWGHHRDTAHARALAAERAGTTAPAPAPTPAIGH